MEMMKLTVAFRNFVNVPKRVPEVLPCVTDYGRRRKRQIYFPKRVQKVNVIILIFHSFVQAGKMYLVKRVR
jgi:hypothetical protein